MVFVRKHAGAWAAAAVLALAFLILFSSTASAQDVQVGVVNRNANLRAGPSTRYAVVGSAPAGTTVRIAGTNQQGDWYQLTNGRWIAAFLVNVNGAGHPQGSIPTVAPTPAPAQTAPVAPSSGNRFVLVEQRLWDVYENGGWLDGTSVHCGESRTLRVNVLDANGSRLNGVAVQVAYGAREIEVTGAQGKGDGAVEFVLGGGQDVKVVRDTNGSPATSDVATGLSTNAANIAHADLIAARYCQDEESCRQFGANNGCLGHFSWTVTFQRR